jgi:hypothetical protein
MLDRVATPVRCLVDDDHEIEKALAIGIYRQTRIAANVPTLALLAPGLSIALTRKCPIKEIIHPHLCYTPVTRGYG